MCFPSRMLDLSTHILGMFLHLDAAPICCSFGFYFDEDVVSAT